MQQQAMAPPREPPSRTISFLVREVVVTAERGAPCQSKEKKEMRKSNRGGVCVCCACCVCGNNEKGREKSKRFVLKITRAEKRGEVGGGGGGVAAWSRVYGQGTTRPPLSATTHFPPPITGPTPE
jgi:hypothetical protein